MLLLQHISYAHPDKDVLFTDLNFTVNRHDKIALTGNNGAGKSTLLKLMAGLLLPSSGSISVASKPWYVPQHYGQYNDCTVAEALGIAAALQALTAILAGDVTAENMALLNDDWTLEERCREALTHWRLSEVALQQKMSTLSGGQKTSVFLAGIMIHRPQLVLLDEPSNHLDSTNRALLYQYIAATKDTLVVVSHDRALLELLPVTCELDKEGITVYGGNYTFYAEQKAVAATALAEDLRSKEKSLRKAKETARETIERQQKLDARGRKKQDKSGVPTIALNTLRNNAERSTARIKVAHAEKTGELTAAINQLRKELPDKDKMALGFSDSTLHQGKVLMTAKGVNYSYSGGALWAAPLTFQLLSGQRIAVNGRNGAGKTTLVKLLLGRLQPTQGAIARAYDAVVYIDQDYSLIDDSRTVYEQAEAFNTGNLPQPEVNSRLSRFLFTKAYWHKPCSALSGGEKMRLSLCCLTIGRRPPDVIILDEPTNNLDIQNVDILVAAINQYRGTLIVISHDAHFLEQVGITDAITLTRDEVSRESSS